MNGDLMWDVAMLSGVAIIAVVGLICWKVDPEL